MEDRLSFIDHHGKPILLIDFSHCTKQQMILLLEQVQLTVAGRERNSLLTLAGFTGAQVDKAVATRIKEVLVLDRPFVRRSAWVGTKSLPHVYYENFRAFSQRNFPQFETREEAMNWLVED
jgi:hypothetical protein